MSLIGDIVGEIYDSRGKVSLEWDIPGYFSLSQRADAYYESPPFLLSCSTWCIRIYPNGQRFDQSVEWLGLYLRKLDDVIIMQPVTVTLGIKRHDGTVFNSYTFKYVLDGMDGESLFMERRIISQLKRAITNNGVLTVFCVASISPGIEVATQTTPVDSTDDLINDFRRLFRDGEKSDVIFKFNGGEVRAHKLILQARSPVLDAMFKRDWKEKRDGIVHITDCDSRTFHEFLLFIYTGKVENMTTNNMTGLYSIADKYEVKELQERCIEFMKKNLTVDTVCDIIAVADRHMEEELRKSAKELLIRNIKEILPTEKWKSFMTENSVLAVELLMAVIPGGCS